MLVCLVEGEQTEEKERTGRQAKGIEGRWSRTGTARLCKGEESGWRGAMECDEGEGG